MDPEDLRALLAGMGCSVCGATVGPDSIRLLARRDDLAFLQLTCPGCGSTTLGIVMGDEDVDGADGHLAALDPRGADAPPDPDAPPLTRDDVEAMRDLLARHHGGLRSLLRTTGEGEGRW